MLNQLNSCYIFINCNHACVCHRLTTNTCDKVCKKNCREYYENIYESMCVTSISQSQVNFNVRSTQCRIQISRLVVNRIINSGEGANLLGRSPIMYNAANM